MLSATFSFLVEMKQNILPVKGKLETLLLVRDITVFTVKVVGVLIVGLLTRFAVLATWGRGRQEGLKEEL